MSKSPNKKPKFLQKPHYEGGMKAMDAFIREHLQYTEEALASKTEGTVKVRIKINHKGKVIGAQILQKLGDGLDEEAIRVVKLLRFSVAKNLNLRVTFQKELNIHFKMPEKPGSVQKINYIYTKQAEEPAKPSYTYQING